MASRAQSQTITAVERTPWRTMQQLPISRVVAAIALLVSLVAATVLVRSREATIADQQAVMRQQAATIAHYQQTTDALSGTVHQYAARLLVLSEVAALDSAIIDLAGQLEAQHLAVERALTVGDATYAEAAMLEQMLQSHLTRFLAQRQELLAPGQQVTAAPSANTGRL